MLDIYKLLVWLKFMLVVGGKILKNMVFISILLYNKENII